jgi:hypothetical protein
MASERKRWSQKAESSTVVLGKKQHNKFSSTKSEFQSEGHFLV